MIAGSRARALAVACTGLALCGVALLWPEPKERSPFSLAVGVWPGMETLTLARETGLLPDQGMNFVELSWSSATMMAFENRVVDGAVVTLNEMLRLKAGGHAIKAVLVLGASVGGDAILTRPQLTSLAELKGKKVGVELRASGEYVLARALRSAGLSMKDITIVPLNSAEAEAAYEQGELDAVVTRDPWRLRLEARGARVVFDSRQLETPLYRVLVVREDLLKENQKELKRLLEAHFTTLPSLVATGGMSHGMDAVLRREGLTQPQFEESLKRIVFFNRDENEKLLGQGPGSLDPVVKEMARTMEEEGLLAGGEATGNLLDASVVKGVR